MVATGLTLPWGVAVLPDGTALVGERTTGRLLVVQPQRAPAKLVRRMTGLDATGDGGLLGLALSPDYEQDGLVYAYGRPGPTTGSSTSPCAAPSPRC